MTGVTSAREQISTCSPTKSEKTIDREATARSNSLQGSEPEKYNTDTYAIVNTKTQESLGKRRHFHPSWCIQGRYIRTGHGFWFAGSMKGEDHCRARPVDFYTGPSRRQLPAAAKRKNSATGSCVLTGRRLADDGVSPIRYYTWNSSDRALDLPAQTQTTGVVFPRRVDSSEGGNGGVQPH